MRILPPFLLLSGRPFSLLWEHCFLHRTPAASLESYPTHTFPTLAPSCHRSDLSSSHRGLPWATIKTSASTPQNRLPHLRTSWHLPLSEMILLIYFLVLLLTATHPLPVSGLYASHLSNAGSSALSAVPCIEQTYSKCWLNRRMSRNNVITTTRCTQRVYHIHSHLSQVDFWLKH